jgi:hypothetical protein
VSRPAAGRELRRWPEEQKKKDRAGGLRRILALFGHRSTQPQFTCRNAPKHAAGRGQIQLDKQPAFGFSCHHKNRSKQRNSNSITDMKTRRTHIGLAAAILVLATAGLRAEMGSGTYTNEFNGDVNLWDVSGTYGEDLAGLSLHYTLNMDASGKFAGQGAVSLPSFAGVNLSLNADYSFHGTVTTAGSAVRVTMAMKMKGSGEVQGTNFTFSASATEHLTPDPANRQLTGSVTGSESISIPIVHMHSTVPLRTTTQMALPAGMNGTWRLALDVSPDGNKYQGTGSVTLSNGKTIPVTVTGNYAAKTGVSRLTLKGAGINLSLMGLLQNGQIVVQKLNGKALGQKLRK